MRQDGYALRPRLRRLLYDSLPLKTYRANKDLGWGIIPAVGIAYSGYCTRSNALAAVMPAILTVTVCSIQWFIIGYSLTYSEGGYVLGDFTYAFHRGVLAEPVGTIPAVLFSFFQLVFQATVCAIAVGGASERGRLLPLVPFIFVRFSFRIGSLRFGIADVEL